MKKRQGLCTKSENISNRTFVLNRKKTKLKKITPEEEEERKKEKVGTRICRNFRQIKKKFIDLFRMQKLCSLM